MYNTNINPNHHPTPDKKTKKQKNKKTFNNACKNDCWIFSSKIQGQNSKLFVKPICAGPYTAHKNEVFH